MGPPPQSGYDAEAVGARIKALLLAQDMSQTDLAKLTGIQQPVMNKLIRGRLKRPNAEYLLAIAQKLGVSTDYLLQGIGPPEEAPVRVLGAAMTIEEFLAGADGDDVTQGERRFLEHMAEEASEVITRTATREEWWAFVRVLRAELARRGAAKS
jgi:transcriptional regulator with XRE-family HTH domain